MINRKKILKIIAIMVLGIIIFGSLSRLTGNVFDMIGLLGYRAIRQFEGISISTDNSHSSFWYDDFIERYVSTQIVSYHDDYLREGEWICFTFYNRPITDKLRKNVYIRAYKDVTDTVSVCIDIQYDYYKRTIIYEPLWISGSISSRYTDEANIRRLMEKYSITEEDIREFQEYVLYDVILKGWQRASGSNYDIEKWKLQQCRVEDLTFEFEE